MSQQGSNYGESSSSSSSSSSGRPAVRTQQGRQQTDEFVGRTNRNGNEVFTRKKRIPVIQKSLAIVLASLLGEQVVIELKNDTEVTGTIEETDTNMNLTLNDVRQVFFPSHPLHLTILPLICTPIIFDVVKCYHISIYLSVFSILPWMRLLLRDKLHLKIAAGCTMQSFSYQQLLKYLPFNYIILLFLGLCRW